MGNLVFSGTNVSYGLDASKPASPNTGDIYAATDTEKLYVCYTTGVWTDPTKSNSGSYTGDSTANRAIAHGLSGAPKIVLIMGDTTAGFIITGYGYLFEFSGAGYHNSVSTPDATSFYVGNATTYAHTFNLTGKTYFWVALS